MKVYKKVYIGIHVMMMIGKINGYNLTCPVPEQLQFQGTWICKDTESYMCIYDDNNKIYTESCDGPVLFGKGYKAIIRGNIDREHCSDTRYQPYPFNTLRNIKCVFIKSFCNEEGQVTVKNGLAFEDRVCNCDYSKGYAFTLTPRKLFNCIPSEEDCSCYKKLCPEEYRYLSPDYKCIEESNSTTPLIPDTTTGSTKFVNSVKYNTVFLRRDLSTRTKVAFLAFFLICLVIGIIILAFFTKYLNCLSSEAGQCSIQLRNNEHFMTSEPKVTFVEDLKDVVCFVGECARFRCIVKEKIGVNWFKYMHEVEENNRTRMHSTDHVHKLIIDNVTPEDRGHYVIHVQTIERKASLIVIDDIRFTKEDANYLRIVNLLLKKALPAVRHIFDGEIHPKKLYDTVYKNRNKLDNLRDHRHINSRQWISLMRRKEAISSKNFDLRLLICLLRNIGPELPVIDDLPLHSNTSLSANLSRIKFYRNEIAHSHGHGRLPDEKFSIIWKGLCQSIQGLGTPITIDPKNTNEGLNCTSDNFAKALTDSISLKNRLTHNIERLLSTDELNYLRIVHLLHRVVCSAVRIKFNSLFPPEQLQNILDTKKDEIKKLFNKKKITPSEWSVLYPEIGLPFSQTFGIRLLIHFILNYAKEHITEDDIVHLPKLTDISHEIAESLSGTLSRDAFNEYFDKISTCIFALSGKYKNRFIDMCCSICPENSQHLLYTVGQ